ncbi:hypothetical protein, partial [Tepidanaerobacter sp. EBM-38]|uniref:hypothetical protein n=1 Tax=Tepidanaerobacter sp. EBM-38 TaxID=1918496 RepID=UPI000A952611
IPALGKIQREYSLGRIIIVADRGITTGDNIWYILSAKNGYILSYSVQSADREFKVSIRKKLTQSCICIYKGIMTRSIKSSRSIFLLFFK